MKLRLLGLIFLFFMGSVHAELQIRERYQSVTTESFMDIEPSERVNLISCVANWKLYGKKTTSLQETLIQMKSSDSPILILEVGNSGFGRYDFIVASKDIFRSSLTNSAAKGSEELQKLFMELDMNRIQDFVDSGSPNEDDGNCYFLMVKKNGIERRVAVYGTPRNTKVGTIIKKMLNLAVKQQR